LLRERELSSVLGEFRDLPESERKPAMADSSTAIAAKRPVPQPPPKGAIIRGYCTYLRRGEDGTIIRAREFYYKENPDRWAAETQSDMLWLTEAEWKSLIPTDPRPGVSVSVDPAIQHRFFSTIGIDYLEGSVNSLLPRRTELALTVVSSPTNTVSMRLDGYAAMGHEFQPEVRTQPHTRGCEIRVLGWVDYDTDQRTLTRFDIVGLGQAWGNKMNDTQREIRLESHPWYYGIACELVKGSSPLDLIPPYNLIHYGSAGPYFPRNASP
jgi:hypothetical protein